MFIDYFSVRFYLKKMILSQIYISYGIVKKHLKSCAILMKKVSHLYKRLLHIPNNQKKLLALWEFVQFFYKRFKKTKQIQHFAYVWEKQGRTSTYKSLLFYVASVIQYIYIYSIAQPR